MQSDSDKPHRAASVLRGRRLLTCRACGWVHYEMTAAEKAAHDHALQPYQLSDAEWLVYESAFRQCLRCESPASEFRAADERDLERAAGHMVTPVYTSPMSH